jgi:glycerol-3-phosphate acyltransferase PlsY
VNANLLILIASLAAAFLAGSIPFGLWIARMRGIDLKTVGSGNIGFTNVWRSTGKLEGILTLAGDVGKGALPTALLPLLLVQNAGGGVDPSTAALLYGMAAVAGHCFSPFAGFRGGKGVATSLGVFLVLAPVAIGICVLAFVLLVGLTRYISLGSITCAVLLPTVIGWRQGIGPLFWVAVAIGLLVIVRHRENIVRLLAGSERKFRFGSK